MEINGLKIEFANKDLANCVYLDGEVEIPVYGYCHNKTHLYTDEESGEVISEPNVFRLKNICGFREKDGAFVKKFLTEILSVYKKDEWCIMGYIDPDTHKFYEYIVDSTYVKMYQWWVKIEGYKRAVGEIVLKHELEIVKEVKEKIALTNK